jgi:NAD(P)-dependent dehydrogenase (short-subunit alcohol dehydrogenase family)
LFNNQPEPFYSRYIAKVPRGRMAAPDDLKGVTVFLVSSASSYITGAVIPVDGGLMVQ